VIEVSACGMNNTDIWVRRGAYGTEQEPGAVSTWRRQENTLTFPRIQRTDAVGTIVAAGSGVVPARSCERRRGDFRRLIRDVEEGRSSGSISIGIRTIPRPD
jgi:alcohol dehydrogenase